MKEGDDMKTFYNKNKKPDSHEYIKKANTPTAAVKKLA